MRRALWLVVIGAAAVAWADKKHPNPFLSQAKAFAQQSDGDKCLKRLIQAEQKWKYNDKTDKAEIELYGGICGYLIGETVAAEVSFKNAIKIDPKINLPANLGPGIDTLWAKATGKSAPSPTGAPPPTQQPPPDKKDTKVAAKPPDAPPPPPEPPKPVVDTPREKRLTPDEQLDKDLSIEAERSYTPKKKSKSIILPVVLGVAGIGAGAVGIVLGLQAKSHEAKYKDPMMFYSDVQAIGSQARTEALITNFCFAAAGALVIGAVIAFILG